MLELAIVIINYKTPNLVIDCLQSLETEINSLEHQVIVVDNASGDNSLLEIEAAITENHWQTWVKLLPSGVNGGCSAGNNLGLKAVIAQTYLLLNSDTIVRPGAIRTLLEARDKYPEVGIFSPRLEWPDTTPQISCFRYHTPISELIDGAATSPVTRWFYAYDVPIPISDTPFGPQWTSFACVMIRRQVIEQIGYMDDGYFMYYEDVDYCRRAQIVGWQILHIPQARVVHLRGGSGSVKAEIAKRRRPPSYLYASRSRYFAKYYGKMGLWLTNCYWLLGRSLAGLREILGNKQPHTCEAQEQDIWFNWRHPLK